MNMVKNPARPKFNIKNLTYKQYKEGSSFLFTLPTLLFMLVFMIIPILMGIVLSFTNWNVLSPEIRLVGLGNYIKVLSTPRFIKVLKNTIYLVILFVPLMNMIAIIMAALIGMVSNKIGNLYKSLIFYPCLISMVIVGFIWKLIFNYNNGLINTTLRLIGLDALAMDWLGNSNIVLLSITVGLIWSALGYYLVIYVAGIMSVPEELYEAAEIEGCGSVKKFFHITIPMLASSITINVVLSTMGVFTSFGIILALTQGGPGYSSQTLALEVYTYAFERLRYPEGLANGVILGIFATVVMLLELKFLLKREDVY
jgi:ABC-type sugar transport system permease subunit